MKRGEWGVWLVGFGGGLGTRGHVAWFAADSLGSGAEGLLPGSHLGGLQCRLGW